MTDADKGYRRPRYQVQRRETSEYWSVVSNWESAENAREACHGEDSADSADMRIVDTASWVTVYGQPAPPPTAKPDDKLEREAREWAGNRLVSPEQIHPEDGRYLGYLAGRRASAEEITAYYEGILLAVIHAIGGGASRVDFLQHIRARVEEMRNEVNGLKAQIAKLREELKR